MPKRAQFTAMQTREFFEHLLSLWAQEQMHDPPILGGGPSPDEAELLAARCQRHDAVMLCLQPLRQSADGRPTSDRIPLDLQQKLILQRRQTMALRQLLAMPQETAKFVAKVRERLVLPQ